MQAVILSFDSLATYSIGCYGNEWVETPNWDRLAASGVVFEHHFADTIGQDSGTTWATGHHAHSLARTPTSPSLGSRLRTVPVATRFIVANQPLKWHPCFNPDDISTVDGQEGYEAEPHDVPIAKLVKAGLSAWNEPSFQTRPRLLWLHAPAPGLPPRGFDSLYFDDFEERGQQISELSDEERTNHPATYAGAVSLIDYWLGELLQGVESQSTNEPTMFIVMAAKGHPWHRVIPTNSIESRLIISSLTDQLIRAPLVLMVTGDHRFQELACIRSNRLVQTCDLFPTLLDWFEVDPNADVSLQSGQSWLREATEELSPRRSLWIGSDIELDAIRTADWLCVRERRAESPTDTASYQSTPCAALFKKPEDIWDLNNIASQQVEQVAELWRHFPTK